MTTSQARDECADDTAKMIYALNAKYKKVPGLLIGCLANTLAGYIALVSADPQKTLDDVANHLKLFDHARTRTDYFGFRLGVIPGGEEHGTRRESDPND